MANDEKPSNEISDVLSAPLEDLVASVARGVAVAQHEIDRQSIENFKEVHLSGRQELEELRRLGYQPTWYRIPEATAQVKVSLSVRRETKADVHGELSARPRVFAATVDAAYSNSYNYNLSASSSLTFRIVPVPPSPQLDGLRVIPELVGRAWSEASALLDELDIPFDTGGATPEVGAKIASTSPGRGELLTSGQVLTIAFE